MSVNTYFDKIFCINLDERTDRWKECLEEFGRWDIYAVERVSAYRAEGHKGCTYSHRALIQRIAEGPWQRVLVLEDDFHVLTLKDLLDAKFTVDSTVVKTFINGGRGSFNSRFGRMVERVPTDWDVLYLGGGYRDPPLSRINEHVIRTRGMLTTSSYGITKQFAPVLLEEMVELAGPIEECTAYPIDGLFSESAAKHNFYILQPRLMIQRKGYSDITGETGHYLMSMTDPVHEGMI